MVCFDTFLQNEYRVLPRNSASDCIILFCAKRALRTRKSETENKNNDIVLKLTNEPTRFDNSLEVERDVYKSVKNELQFWSPHFLVPITTGSCSDESIVKEGCKKGASSEAKSLYKSWALMRVGTLAKMLEDQEQKLAEEKKRRSGSHKKRQQTSETKKSGILPDFYHMAPTSIQGDRMKFAQFLMSEKAGPWQKMARSVHFTATPRIDGEPFNTFCEKNPNLPASFLLEMLVQIAQVLLVLAVFKIQHNDLHSGNWFITLLPRPRKISYTYPFKCSFKTRYFVTIMDWDRAALEPSSKTGIDLNIAQNVGIEHANLCRDYGQCNTYVPKKDWYTVLTNTIIEASINSMAGETQIRTLMGSLYDDDPKTIGHDVHPGLPCTLIKKGARCVAKPLTKLVSPLSFFKKYVVMS